MAHHKEIFEDCEIEIKDDNKLLINSKEIDYEHDRDINKWSSRYLPYTRYDSLLEMARAIAQHTVEFSNTKE
ncbi:hypothetical protein [Nitrosomonas sp.]|uniref:hypothetical protein n=1 Tax=Nitrosomonas sp. TaxID=42353 RepID=UPI0020881EA4|nr:hypothetical protein [Nitrosomonas sp.]GJL76152.1 MAG: hypothetical protein NMNS02_22580 [Nitrosomonas sp.]